MAISSKRPSHRDLEYLDFFVDDLVLIVAPSHRWARYNRIFPNDLLAEPLLVPDETSSTYKSLISALSDYGITGDMLDVNMVLGNPEEIVMAVEASLGVAFVSRLVAGSSLELDRIVEIGVSGLDLTRMLYLIRNRRCPQTQTQAAFWNFVTQKKDGGQIPYRQAERQLT